MPIFVSKNGLFLGALSMILCACTIVPHPNELRSAMDEIPREAVLLRERAPRDSVLLYRGTATILLSMREVDSIAAHVRYDPRGDFARFFGRIRARYAVEAVVELGVGGMEDRLAADLIAAGRATIRVPPDGNTVPWVRVVRERETGGNTRTYRAIYMPDGTLTVRVIDSIIMS